MWKQKSSSGVGAAVVRFHGAEVYASYLRTGSGDYHSAFRREAEQTRAELKEAASKIVDAALKKNRR